MTNPRQSPPLNKLPRRLLRIAFRQLYTNFAWTYDMVAAIVSSGEWKEWGEAAIPFISRGNASPLHVLELAHGPGHLHVSLRQWGFNVVGLDLSPQMSAMAHRRLEHAGLSNTLIRASVYQLPFPNAAFDALVSTFPTEFIFAPQMLCEAWRVLVEGGRLVVVPAARPHHTGPLTPAVTAWQRITHLSKVETATVRDQFRQVGFAFEEHHVATRRADVIVWVCLKSETPDSAGLSRA